MNGDIQLARRRRLDPLAHIGIGGILTFIGIAFVMAAPDTIIGPLATMIGSVMLLIGCIAQGIRLGLDR